MLKPQLFLFFLASFGSIQCVYATELTLKYHKSFFELHHDHRGSDQQPRWFVSLAKALGDDLQEKRGLAKICGEWQNENFDGESYPFLMSQSVSPTLNGLVAQAKFLGLWDYISCTWLEIRMTPKNDESCYELTLDRVSDCRVVRGD